MSLLNRVKIGSVWENVRFIQSFDIYINQVFGVYKREEVKILYIDVSKTPYMIYYLNMESKTIQYWAGIQDFLTVYSKVRYENIS